MTAWVHGKLDVNVLLSFVFGVVFVVTMLVFAVEIPNPTNTQQWTFVTVLALAAAGAGSVIPGLLNIDLPYVKAGGALALFVIVFLMKPTIVANLATFTPPQTSPDAVIAPYLKATDDKDLASAWSQLDPAAQTSVARDKDAYRQAYQGGRDPAGPVETRTFIGVQEVQSPSGFAPGIYRSNTYRTKFANGNCRIENVTVRSAEEQRWRVYEHNLSQITIPCA